jgi:hypothetical protein
MGLVFQSTTFSFSFGMDCPNAFARNSVSILAGIAAEAAAEEASKTAESQKFATVEGVVCTISRADAWGFYQLWYMFCPGAVGRTPECMRWSEGFKLERDGLYFTRAF